MDNVKAYLYDARGRDEEVAIEEIDIQSLNDDQILWVVIFLRDRETLANITETLGLKNVPCDTIIDEERGPALEKYDDFFCFSVDSVDDHEKSSPARHKINYIVGKNVVVTVSTGEPKYFQEYRNREKGESSIGELDSESLVASLLDQNIVSYFRALHSLESRIDKIDERILKEELDIDKFLDEMVRLRSDASKLRRWLMPHREVYYALSRPDFQQVAESTATEHYRLLSQHFENAVDAIEHARESVLGVFDLYATKSSHMTNILIQRLTILTLVLGTIGVMAGILGMNFKADIFEAEYGFWITVSGLVIVGVAITAVARMKRWI